MVSIFSTSNQNVVLNSFVISLSLPIMRICIDEHVSICALLIPVDVSLYTGHNATKGGGGGGQWWWWWV